MLKKKSVDAPNSDKKGQGLFKHYSLKEKQRSVESGAGSDDVDMT